MSAELEELIRWKAEAMEVISGWEKVADLTHDVSQLGHFKWDVAADKIKKLLAVRAAAAEYRTLVHAPHEGEDCECVTAGDELDAAIAAARW